jgi:gluconolactonase
VTHHPSFDDVLGAAPQLAPVVVTPAHEGPVYAPSEDALYFTTTPAPRPGPAPGDGGVRIDRVQLTGTSFPLPAGRVTTALAPTQRANGMTLHPDGGLVVCEQGSAEQPARLAHFDPQGGHTLTLVDRWRGLRLNSPNDVVVKRDATIWFTDPAYGHLQGFRPEPEVGDYVYRFDPVSGDIAAVADGFAKPNGLAFSPDEEVLYVGDSGANQEPGSFFPHLPHHVLAFDVEDGRRLGPPRLFAVIAPGFPDGLKTDDAGRVYVSAFSGVLVYDPDGTLIGEITLPGAVNFTFGGPDRNVLFITTDDAIWAAVLHTTGGPPPSPSSEGA